ncbi:MAG: NADH-quinone oxidoreductase subunit, partial [Baekduia sp.]|nr:NADH-quinone oxidoreductase subunit [Baekduia sp.]
MILANVIYFEPWWMQILKAIVIFAVGLQIVPIALMADRKVMGRMQNRYGPNRVGPFGALTPIADIGKLLFKQQFRPKTSIGWLFRIAPIISILTAIAAFGIIPFGEVNDIFGTKTGLYGLDVSIGPLYLFA